MSVDGNNTHQPLKRRRLLTSGTTTTTTDIDTMEFEAAKARMEEVKEKFGRDLRVFETSPALSSSPSQVSNDEETEGFYEFMPEDYHRILATKKQDKYLKTRKLREAEETARKSRFTQAIIRVRFPDNHTLEAVFHPSDKLQSLFDLIVKVIAKPDLSFYLYTTPPKKQIKDLSQDLYSAGFVPGAIIYFSYNLSEGEDTAALSSGPFLGEEIMSLKHLDAVTLPADPVQNAPEPETAPEGPPSAPQYPKLTEKKPAKPKWFKM